MEFVVFGEGGDAASLEHAFGGAGLKVSRESQLRELIARLRKPGARVLILCAAGAESRTAAIIRDIRTHGVCDPALVLTNSISQNERRVLQEAGADEVIERSIGVEAIVARAVLIATIVVRYAVRRYCDGSLLIERETGWVRCNDRGTWRSVRLTRMECDFLRPLARSAGTVVSHSVLDKRVFARDMRADRGKRVAIKNKVAAKIALISARKKIISVRGEGYMLSEGVPNWAGRGRLPTDAAKVM
jgi:DNA-binding response OmpR family regulator